MTLKAVDQKMKELTLKLKNLVKYQIDDGVVLLLNGKNGKKII